MGSLFSPEDVERVRAASDIVEVVGAVLPLKRAGANFVALCPFHKEKSPSFNVNPHRQIFHCFGCHKGGDVFTFVKEYESIDFPEAVRRLAERARIPLLSESQPGAAPARHLKELLLQIHEQIAQRWEGALSNEAGGEIAREYLAKRGVTAEAIKQFRLGYAPDSWEDTVNWSRSKGFALEVVEQAGLILRRQEDTGYYDRFRGRLIFPICDEQGRIVGFSGRVLGADQKTAKYVNSPETPIFTKGKIFYGLDKSKRALLETEQAIVCEGQLDLIACHTAGVANVIAPQGTAFTADHARILKRYVKEVVLCFDSDEAGHNAALRSLDHLLTAELAVRVAMVPAPHDPDSYIKAHGAGAFQKVIQEAEGFFDYHLKRLCSLNDLQSDKGRLTVLRDMADAVNKTRNYVLIDNYAQKTALRLGVRTEAVRAEFQKFASRHQPQSPASDAEMETGEQTIAPPSADQEWLLKLLFCHEELIEWPMANLKLDWVSHPVVREIIARRLAAHRDGSWTTMGAFLEQLPDALARNLVTEAATVERSLSNPAQMMTDVTTKLRNQFLDAAMAALLNKIGQPDLPETERDQAAREREELRLLKKISFPPCKGS